MNKEHERLATAHYSAFMASLETIMRMPQDDFDELFAIARASSQTKEVQAFHDKIQNFLELHRNGLDSG